VRAPTLAVILGLTIAAAAAAHDFRAGDIVIDHPWADPVIAGQPVGAAYMTIRNEGSAPERILGARTDVAERVELHAMTMVDGAMRMTPLETIEAPPGEEVVFAPGGAHLMLIGPNRAFAAGERFAMTLVLETAGEVEVEVHVQAPRAPSGESQDHDGHAP
jgi:copper(I)-binding protein